MRISDWSSDVCSSDLTITRHLIELGHRDIGHIRGHPGHMASAERHRGFNDALAEAGLDPDAAPVEQGYFSYKSRSEEHTSELQSLMRISYAVFCLKKKTYQLKYTMYIDESNKNKII